MKQVLSGIRTQDSTSQAAGEGLGGGPGGAFAFVASTCPGLGVLLRLGGLHRIMDI